MTSTGEDVEIKNCDVKLEGIVKLRTCFVKIKKCSGVPPTQIPKRKLTKEEKNILLPHKKTAAKKSSTNSVKGRVTKKNKKLQVSV